MELIKPVQVTVTDADRCEHVFTISRLPATVAREVIAKYVGGGAPKIGDYGANHDAMLKMMRYVAVEINGALVPLKTSAMIDNHVPDGEALIRLEIEMLRHNTSFFGSAGSQTLGAFLQSKFKDLSPRIMQMLTPLLQQLSQKD